ncbi:homeobox protein Nkx-3.2 [Drosophila takahashii]|uniref:homeobox protein Nkx-3.2 n=1 Tax=Drosophila takahashii TaxID=29030 RepID=UPI001CF926E7|nr:homeobox protein Nkx-3.2 [Drosophila takahashii]
MPQRTPSPANSEISVGSPSPPPMRSLNMKRLRLLRSPVNLADGRQRSSPVRIKSFSIADILGRGNEEGGEEKKPERSAVPSVPVPGVSAPLVLINERLQMPLVQMQNCPPPPPAALHPFLSPALLHSYEQRLAWDYQRQLQEHFQAQAHLLRHMTLNPAIIASEDGSSERSQRSSSSNGSTDCCTPRQAEKLEKLNTPEGGEGAAKKSEAEQPTGARKSNGDTPLDALFQLSTKNFDEEQDPATLNIFATRSNPKKKRKSRTAFSNQQIFELEKRFLYQKYLSPADRDEIAGGLGLSNAQVITWFQNRRAKLKRDMEELKKDVQCEKLPDQSAEPNRSHHHHHHQPQHHHPHMQSFGADKDKDREKDKDKDKEELRMLKLMTLMRYSDGKLLYTQPPPTYLPPLQRQNSD